MAISEYLEQHLNNFLQSLYADNFDLVDLFSHNRITFTEDGKAGYFPYENEMHATKEQKERMDKVFNEYWENHPL